MLKLNIIIIFNYDRCRVETRPMKRFACERCSSGFAHFEFVGFGWKVRKIQVSNIKKKHRKKNQNTFIKIVVLISNNLGLFQSTQRWKVWFIVGVIRRRSKEAIRMLLWVFPKRSENNVNYLLRMSARKYYLDDSFSGLLQKCGHPYNQVTVVVSKISKNQSKETAIHWTTIYKSLCACSYTIQKGKRLVLSFPQEKKTYKGKSYPKDVNLSVMIPRCLQNDRIVSFFSSLLLQKFSHSNEWLKISEFVLFYWHSNYFIK